MDLLTWLEALLKLGIPMLAMSWLAFSWLYNAGEVDRNSSRKEIASRVKNVKKNTLGSGNKKARFLLQRWSRFGGGFYGLAGCWTIIVIEVNDLVAFLQAGGFANMSGIGIPGLLIDIVVNQISNLISAAIWFSYWPEPTDSIFVWVLIAFIGYRLGIELAKGRINLNPRAQKSLETPASEER